MFFSGWFDRSAPSIAAVAALAAHHPLVANTIFVTIMVTLGMAFLVDGTRGWVYVLSLGWLGFSWWIGQDFGALLSGTGTDPNTALPLALLTLAVAPRLPWRWSEIGFADVRHFSAVPATRSNVRATSDAAPRIFSDRY